MKRTGRIGDFEDVKMGRNGDFGLEDSYHLFSTYHFSIDSISIK
jgi:hypothetical protein